MADDNATYGNAGDNRQSTFGRSLMNYVSNNLPYGKSSGVLDNIAELNPNYKDFLKVGDRKEQLLTQHAISTAKPGGDNSGVGQVALDKNYHAFMYANVDFDKSKRLRDYRVMAQFAEVADALDEICDDCIVTNRNGEVVRLELDPQQGYDINISNQIHDEFRKFIKHYEINEKGWEYFRSLLVDGEIFFEHVIHKQYKDAGILGIISVPSELVDPIYDNVQNLLIKGFLLRKPQLDQNQKDGQGGAAPQPDVNKKQFIPFEKNQVTYINSGIWNETKSLRLPFIEHARRAYRQLSLIEDAIIIYRLVRAPERLVFNVDVGTMPPPKAEAYLKKLMSNYWSRKTYDSSQGKGVQAFNPQSMLDSFWFAKRQGSEGTQVTSLPGGQNLGELDDLKYFRQKLYRALKVPVARLDPEAQATSDGSTILREELKFARFIIRLQQQFAQGLKQAFVTHLKLRKLWDDYEIKENHFILEFNAPENFNELRNQQLHELKWNNYSTAIGNPLVSDTYAKKHMLKWSDSEIKVNRDMLRKDKALAWELAQIEAQGPNWREQFMQGEEGEAASGADMAGGAPPMGGGIGPAPGGGGDIPPDFGPAPAGDAPAPEGGEPPAGPAPVGGETALP